MAAKTLNPRWVMCVENADYQASLELRKVYRVVADRSAARMKMIRVVDESGKDYLYPQTSFVPVELPPKARPLFARPTAT
jgi:hypothetical protein